MDFLEKKEIAVESYSQTFDKNMAYEKARLSKEEITVLEEDQEFQSRLKLFLILERESLITALKDFKTSYDDKLKFKAIIELGKYLYPERFVEPPKDFNHTIKDERSKEEIEEEDNEDKRVEKEYSLLLNGAKLKNGATVIVDGKNNNE